MIWLAVALILAAGYPWVARQYRRWLDRPDPAWRASGVKRPKRQKYDFERAVRAKRRAEIEADQRRILAAKRGAIESPKPADVTPFARKAKP